LNAQNIYVERSNKLLEYQNFLQHCSLFLSPNKIIFLLKIIFRSVSKFSNTSRKLFFFVYNFDLKFYSVYIT